jgi:hypothetical protein
MPEIWIRRSIILLLSPVGLLLISVTRLMIIADYNTTTAVTIASSGGYINTLLGTAIPLIPILLPYFAILLLLFRRFILSALAFGASILITPTRLAPITALNSFLLNWHRIVALVRTNILLSILVLFALIALDVTLASVLSTQRSLTVLAVAVILTAYLLPYILYAYPLPRNSNYYEQFMRQPWLSAELITTKSPQPIIGYVLTEDDNWTVVLTEPSRVIQYVRSDEVLSRSVCLDNSSALSYPQSPILPLLRATPAKLPACFGPVSGNAGSHEPEQWTAAPAQTASASFQDVPGIAPIDICSAGNVVATVSVELEGAPAGFQLLVDGNYGMAPGLVRFTPAGPLDSFSFTFVQDLVPVGSSSRHVLQLQWRSPNSLPTSLQRGTVDIRYEGASAGC